MTKQAKLSGDKTVAIAEATGTSTDKKAQMADTLRRRIISMALPPGAVVDEVAVSEEFGLSRPPVRELMRQLAAEGYLELEANRPARVSPMSHQSLRSFFLAAPLIYIATTQLAAVHATREQVKRLRAIQAKFCKAIKENDMQSRVLYNEQFHHEIGLIADNAYLMPSLRRLLIDHARLAKTFYRLPATEEMQQDMDAAMLQHDQIIDAIERHDPDAAETLVREHWELSRRRMNDYVMPDGVAVSLQL